MSIKLNSTQLLEDVVTAYGSEAGPKQAKATKKELEADKNAKGKYYRTIVYNKIAFNIDETTYQQWQNGELSMMVLDEVKRTVTVEETDAQGVTTEQEREIDGYQFIKAVTKTAAFNNRKFDVQMSALDNMSKEVGLSTEKLNALQVAAL